MFCNAFRVYPSNRLDSLSLKLVVVNFLLDPFTYVLFKKNFKRNLKQSITELIHWNSLETPVLVKGLKSKAAVIIAETKRETHLELATDSL